MQKELPQTLRVSTKWIELEVISDADVILTTFGYTPFLRVQEINTGTEYRFYISAKSLGAPLEELRKNNNGNFKGIRFSVRKESIEKMSKYEILSNESIQDKSTSETMQENMRSSEDIQKKLEQVLS